MGEVYEGSIQGVFSTYAFVRLPDGREGWLPATEVRAEESDMIDLTSVLHDGMKLPVYVMGEDDSSGRWRVSLRRAADQLRKKEEQDDESDGTDTPAFATSSVAPPRQSSSANVNGSPAPTVSGGPSASGARGRWSAASAAAMTPESVGLASEVDATVASVFPRHTLLKFDQAPDVVGFLPAVDFTAQYVKDMRDHLKEGKPLRVAVINVGYYNGKLQAKCSTKLLDLNRNGEVQSSPPTPRRASLLPVVSEGPSRPSVLPTVSDGPPPRPSPQPSSAAASSPPRTGPVVSSGPSRETRLPQRAPPSGPSEASAADVEAGKVYVGEVKSHPMPQLALITLENGAFVSLHASEVGYRYVSDIAAELPVGEKVLLVLREIVEDRRGRPQIRMTMKRNEDAPMPHRGDEFEGRVSRTAKDYVFVKMPNGMDGLLHRRNVPVLRNKREPMSVFFDVCDPVKVKVTEVEQNTGRGPPLKVSLELLDMLGEEDMEKAEEREGGGAEGMTADETEEGEIDLADVGDDVGADVDPWAEQAAVTDMGVGMGAATAVGLGKKKALKKTDAKRNDDAKYKKKPKRRLKDDYSSHDDLANFENEDEEAEMVRKMERIAEKKLKKMRKEREERMPEGQKPVVIPLGQVLTVGQVADKLDVGSAAVVKHLMLQEGVMANAMAPLQRDMAVKVVEAFGREVAETDEVEDDEAQLYDEEEARLLEELQQKEDDPASLKPRPPIITIMGHVDHGKTSLLDAIRSTTVAAKEAGGITQHIGAYTVKGPSGDSLTFIDTPGHAAFSQMRSRGANVTDVVVLVVAADDSVMEQTRESIRMCRAAGVPVVVAITKIDKPEANPDSVIGDLASEEIVVEDLGGDIQCARVSAMTKDGLDDLLEKLAFSAEIMDLKANPDRPASGTVLEASVEQGLGVVATTLIQRGTLRVGDIVVAGGAYGKIRALRDWQGRPIKEAGPSEPVQVVGINREVLPSAGDPLEVVDTEFQAKALAEVRRKITSTAEGAGRFGSLLSETVATIAGENGDSKELTVVVKADVQGSAEAVSNCVGGLFKEDPTGKATVKVVLAEAGPVTKTDVVTASVGRGLIIAFNVGINDDAKRAAADLGLPLFHCRIVYEAIKEVESRLERILSPTPEGEYAGAAEVKQVFVVGKKGKVAGCIVTDGVMKKGANVRILRPKPGAGSEIVYMGRLRSLRHIKEEVGEMESGRECGMAFDDFEDMQSGDIIECYVDSKSAIRQLT